MPSLRRSGPAPLLLLAAIACGTGDGSRARGGATGTGATAGAATAAGSLAAPKCPGADTSLKVPAGFCATIFADSIGHARHLAVTPDGDVYVNTWSGQYYGNAPTPKGGFLVVLRDSSHRGRADVIQRFGPSASEGGHGGTGVGVYRNAVYAEEGARIVRYALPAGGLAPTGKPEIVLDGLPTTGDHPMHPIAIDSVGHLFVDLGSASNSCQLKNRTLESPGHKPCTELETRGGVWMYDANRTGQRFSRAERFATGIRNAVGLAVGPGGRPYSTQHGRDQLAENWPKLYTPQQGQELPAEELLELGKGRDYGWPSCYYDGTQRKLVLAPEYGGDGRASGECADKVPPIAWFPAHWAPDGLVFYTKTQFPEKYRGGAFIAFHGSWNRAPGPQGGYNVVFQPFANGKPAGQYEIFADGFAGAAKQPDRAAHRPAGVAVGQDGALYVSDDQHGRVWRITYNR